MSDDVFKEKINPNRKIKSNFKQSGRSGTLVTAFEVQNDYLQETIGLAGQELYFKMLLSDSQIRKAYHAISNPIKSATWDIEPASDDPKDLEVAALMKQIIFNDVIGGWKSKLDEILTFPWHGHAVFEVIHKNYLSKQFGPYTGLENLAFRDQRTLDKWQFANSGKLEKIHQLQYGDIRVNDWMDADTLLIFFNEKKGNDNGFPFCRMMYGNYKRKLLYKELQAIGIERAAIPVPHLTTPASVDHDSDAYKDAEEQLQAFTQAEQAYFITPHGYELDLNATATFDPAKVQTAIKAENEEIAGSIVAMWLEMGIGGNSAVGASTGISVDFFRDGIEYIADKIADVINLRLIPNLCELNFPEGIDVLPKLTHNGIADEAGKDLMEIVTGYTKAGVIKSDEALEDHIRKVHGLPKKVEGEMLDNQEAQDDADETKSEEEETQTSEAPLEEEEEENGKEGQLEKEEEADEEIELASKKKVKTPKDLIDAQAPKVSEDIRKTLTFSAEKYINDVMARYRQLPDSKKQQATSKVVMAGANRLKKDLRKTLTETVTLSIGMAKKEVPISGEVKLNSSDREILRMSEKYGDISEIKLNDFSKLPTHIQILLQKQSELISDDSLTELKKRIDFSFSSIETKSEAENVIKQSIEEDAEKFIESNSVNTKGTNSAAIMVNEGRDTYFFDDDVLDEIHSFTFVNFAPKSDICRELAGTTFRTNDAESLRFVPPLHHNCKSYLRANLKISKGLEGLNISTLSPSAEAKKSITL